MFALASLSLCWAATGLKAQRATSNADTYKLFEQRGKMVRLPTGNRLSLYCAGKGSPTVILETGFGGEASHAWHLLQPQIARTTRVCSYDRAGYGFSELGNDLPRDIKHDVTDLHALLHDAGVPAPYLLIGHSDGGHIISAFSDLFPDETAALVFLDAAVLLEKPKDEHVEPMSPELTKYFNAQLDTVRMCLKRAETEVGLMQSRPGNACFSTASLNGLPPKMARALAEEASRTDYWKALLSESKQHYLVTDDHWEKDLLPHRWKHLPLRVFTASVASLDDEHSAALYGIPVTDHAAIAEARKGRAYWEAL